VDAGRRSRWSCRPATSKKTITQGGLEVRLTIVRPAGATGVLPGFLFIHGGGWISATSRPRAVRHDVVADSGFTRSS
jgi:acetyl esterase/lipase